MAYFHSRFIKSRGGLRSRSMRRVACETLEEMQSLHRAYPEQTTINWPPRGSKALKSRSLPMIWIDADRTDILETVESTPVPETYILVLTWLLRKEFWLKYGGREADGESFLATNVRGSLIQLLRAGDWIDEPSSLGLELLNKRLEKIDLGRRSDLNFSSSQSDQQKYDRDFRHEVESTKPRPIQDVTQDEEPEDDTPDFDTMYRNGSQAVRQELWDSRVWMRPVWEDKYGAP